MRIAYDNDYFAMEDVIGREIRDGKYWCSLCQAWHVLWKPENLPENVWAKLLSLTQKTQSSDWYKPYVNQPLFTGAIPMGSIAGVVTLDTESQT